MSAADSFITKLLLLKLLRYEKSPIHFSTTTMHAPGASVWDNGQDASQETLEYLCNQLSVRTQVALEAIYLLPRPSAACSNRLAIKAAYPIDTLMCESCAVN